MELLRSNCEPMGKGPGVACKKRMEEERWKREIINPIDLARDFHLLQIVTVNFDQYFHPKPMGLLGESFDEAKSLRNHETACSSFLDGVTDCIEPNHPHAGGLKPAEDGFQIRFTLGMGHVDVDLLRSECGPE